MLRYHLSILCSVICALALGLHADSLKAADGIWTGTVSGSEWSTTGNWSGGIVADGVGFTANFNSLDITTDPFVVNLNGPRTISNLIFGDTATASAAGWILGNSGVLENVLILDGTAPTVTVNTLGTGKAVTISAVIQGDDGLVKDGAGTLILSGANTYTGLTRVNAGTLSLNNFTAAAYSDGIENNAVLNIGSGGVLQFNKTITGTGTITKAGTTGDVVLTGSVANTQTWDLSTATGGRLFYTTQEHLGTGNITVGAIRFTRQGAGNLTLANNITLMSGGGMGNRAGTLTANNVTLPGAGTLYFNLDDQVTSFITLNGPATTLSGILTIQVGGGNSTVGDTTLGHLFSGAGGITKTSTGRLILTGANTYNGETRINGGTLVISHAYTATSYSGGIVNNATLNINAGGTFASAITGTGNILKTAGNDMIRTSGTTANTQTWTISAGRVFYGGQATLGTGAITMNSGTRLIHGSDASLTTLANAITINSGGGIGNRVGTSLTINNVTLAESGTVHFNEDDQSTVAMNLNGSVTTLTGNLNIEVGRASNAVAVGTVTLGHSFSGVGGITKTSRGTLVLTGTNTYEGATNVNEGVLQVGNAGVGSLGASSAVTVKSADFTVTSNVLGGRAPVLAGTGIVRGNTIIGQDSLNAGILRPGDSGGALNGLLSFNSNLDVKGGSQIQLGLTFSTSVDAGFNIGTITALDYINSHFNGGSPDSVYDTYWKNVSGSYDSIDVTGSLLLGTGGGILPTILVTNNAGSYTLGSIFKLLDWDGVGTLDSLAAGGFDISTDLFLPTLSDGLAWDTSAFTTYGIAVVTPEPGRAFLLMIAASAFIFRRRRR